MNILTFDIEEWYVEKAFGGGRACDGDTLKNRIALREWKGIQNYLLTGSGDFTNNICEREMRTVGTLRNNSLFWGSHVSADLLANKWKPSDKELMPILA